MPSDTVSGEWEGNAEIFSTIRIKQSKHIVISILHISIPLHYVDLII